MQQLPPPNFPFELQMEGRGPRLPAGHQLIPELAGCLDAEARDLRWDTPVSGSNKKAAGCLFTHVALWNLCSALFLLRPRKPQDAGLVGQPQRKPPPRKKRGRKLGTLGMFVVEEARMGPISRFWLHTCDTSFRHHQPTVWVVGLPPSPRNYVFTLR